MFAFSTFPHAAVPRHVPAFAQAAQPAGGAPNELGDAAALLPPLIPSGRVETTPCAPGDRPKRISRLAARPKLCIVEGCTTSLESASRYLQRVRCVALHPLELGRCHRFRESQSSPHACSLT